MDQLKDNIPGQGQNADTQMEPIKISELGKLQKTSKPILEKAHDNQQGVNQMTFLVDSTRTFAQDKLKKLTLVFNNEVHNSNENDEIDPYLVHSTLKQLTTEEVVDADSFLQQSSDVLGKSRLLAERLDAESEALMHSIWNKTNNSEMRERFEELDNEKGIKKIFGSFERSRLARKIDVDNNEVKKLQWKFQAKEDELRDLNRGNDHVKERRKEVLIKEITESIGEIRNEYKELAKDLIGDKRISADIRKSYIEKVISPKVEELTKNNNISPELSVDFFKALNDYMDHRDETDKEKEQYRNKFYKAMGNMESNELQSLCSLFDQARDESIIQELVIKMAASDIDPFIKTTKTYFKEEFEGRDVDDLKSAISDVVSPDLGHRWPKETSFDGRLESVLVNSDDTHIYSMEFWQVVKENPAINQVFGEVVRKQDIEIYQSVLNGSLFDNNESRIEQLKYYPTPDAIRNLVLLATADAAEHRTPYANEVLTTLAEKSDWSHILDEAEKTYPELIKARKLLLTWDYELNNNHPEIREAAEDFIMSIIDKNSKNKQLLILAMKSLSNNKILDILKEQGVVDDDQIKALQKIEGLEKEYFSVPVEMENEDLVINNFFFNKVLRTTLVDVIGSSDETSRSFHTSSLEGLESLSKEIIKNEGNYLVLDYLLSSKVVNKKLSNKNRELIFQLPSRVKVLLGNKFKGTRSFILENSDSLLQDETDLKFLNTVFGEFGQKGDLILRGYQKCIEAGEVSTKEKDLVLEFARQFRIISPMTMRGYKEAKEAGQEKIFVAELRAVAEKLTGSDEVTDKERESPYYNDLLRHVYSNNSGQWGSFEGNESCSDRSSDLSEFKIEKRYEIDLLSQSEIRLKEGQVLDRKLIDEVQKPIYDVAEKIKVLDNNTEKIQKALEGNLDELLKEIVQKNGLQGVDLKAVTTLDEKMSLVLVDSIYGSGSIDLNTVKDLIINYEFTFEDVTDYITGTSDRVSRASNSDYALLCEVGAFYSDRIKEVNRRLVKAAWDNPTIAAIMPNYFKKLALDTSTAQRKDLINRFQVGKLGATESFINQIGKMFEKKQGRKYTPDEVKAIVKRYESWTGGLSAKASTSSKKETRAIYGQLRSQREKTLEAYQAITGQELDYRETSLGEINLQQALDTEASIREGKYNKNQFASYTAQRFIDLFEGERRKIDDELVKFESLSGKQREVLYGYITKNKESANARMVGGVCVAGDNPNNNSNENMWDMPNYFQLVFQEPDTLQCQGLALLHHFSENGKKVLVASFNPSSTYLYSVDEAALFSGIEATLEKFAFDNGFDVITISQNKTIRTNRTGGEFEKAMNKKIAQVGKNFKFTTPRQFSFNPDYQIQDMDVIWERKDS